MEHDDWGKPWHHLTEHRVWTPRCGCWKNENGSLGCWVAGGKLIIRSRSCGSFCLTVKGCWKSPREETERVLVQTSQFFFFLLSLSASLSASRGHQLSKPGHWDLHWHGKLWIRSSDLWSTLNRLNNTVCVPVLFITGSVHYCSQASHHHSRDLWVWAGWYWEGKTKIISKCFVYFEIYLLF